MSEELSMDEKFVKKLIEVLEANLQNEQFGVEELAMELGLSRSQLHRKLHAINGKSTSQYIREYRLEKAMDMLQNNVATASEIAYRVGFGSPTYFNTSFREFYGFPPGEVKFRNSSIDSDNEAFIASKESVLLNKKTSEQKVVWASSLGLLLLIFFSYYFYKSSKDAVITETSTVENNDKSIAVLPFKNWSGDPNLEYISNGMTDAVISRLTKIQAITKVVPFTSIIKYKETDKTIPEIANELGVQHILQGNFQLSGNQVKINVQLIDAPTNNQFWSAEYIGVWKSNEIFNIQAELSENVAKNLNVEITGIEFDAIQRIPTKNREAYSLYLKGKYFGNKSSEEDINNGIKYFEQAIKNDPEFALAYAGLANAMTRKNLVGMTSTEELTEAKDLALKAIALDNTIAEAHSVLGILAGRVEWNWEKAGKEFKLALSLNPSSAKAHFHYAIYLHNIKGDFKEARNHINQALLLDPLSYLTFMVSAKFYLQDGDFDNAFLETARGQEMDRNNLFSYWLNFENYVKQGMNDKAIGELEKSWNMYAGAQENAKAIRIEYNKSGIKGVYKWIIDYDENSGNPYMNTYWLAQKYAFIEENNKALDWLEKTIEINPIAMMGIKYDPYFYNLHSEPRFLAILKRMNLGNYE